MVSTVFESVDAAMAARRRGILLYVRVGGVAVNATEAHGVHDVAGIGQMTVYLPKPAPASLALNTTLEVEIGHPGTVTRRFFGYIPSWGRSLSDRGHTIRVVAVGQLSYLNYADREGTSLPESTLKDVFRSLCEARDVTTYFADETYYPDGDLIYLGGNDAVDGGDVRFDADTSPHSYLQAVAPLFGYRVHDAPDGAPRLSRVSGAPMPQYRDAALTWTHDVGDWIRPRTNINIRTGPGTSYDIIGGIDDTQIAKIIDGPIVNNSGSTGNHWYEFRALNGPTGWGGTINADGVSNVYAVDMLEPVYWFDEGVNLRSADFDIDRTPIVTYVEQIGRSYTGTDGGNSQIRSIPDAVPENDYIAPQTYIHKRYTSPWILTDRQAEGARNVKEIDLSTPDERFKWTTAGRPDVQPGEICVVTMPTWGILNRPLWITRLADDVDDRSGYVQTYSGWSGGGEALPAGEDCDTIPVATSPRHMGNETLSWYADPSPNGEEDTIHLDNPFEDYSSIRVEGYAHGCNSYYNNKASEGSQIEIWQKPDPAAADSADNELRRIGTVLLPTLNEEASKRRNYASSNRYWTWFSLPIGGRLKFGAFDLKFIAGENPDGRDDYEVKGVYLKVCGVGFPDLPGDA